MKTRDSQASDVIIIGGGATGAGIARDCALRGLRVILVERHDIATGATGRNHEAAAWRRSLCGYRRGIRARVH